MAKGTGSEGNEGGLDTFLKRNVILSDSKESYHADNQRKDSSLPLRMTKDKKNYLV
jgi:hypothetical protein